MELKESILVTGSHRSGTTWIGNILALANGTRYVQEPFNRETNPDLNGYRLANMYAHAPDENLEDLRCSYLSYLSPAPLERLILKDPIALFSSIWIQEEFGAQVVCVVRHPAGFVSSLIKWEWEFFFGYFTAQPRLMESLSPLIRKEIEYYARERQEPILQACLLWKAIYGWVLEQNPRKRKWIIVTYENLAKAPQKHFRKLYNQLGLEWTPSVADEVAKMSGEQNPKESDDPGFRARNSKAMRDVWMNRLTSEQISLIATETAPIWRKFYSKKDWVVH